MGINAVSETPIFQFDAATRGQHHSALLWPLKDLERPGETMKVNTGKYSMEKAGAYAAEVDRLRRNENEA